MSNDLSLNAQVYQSKNTTYRVLNSSTEIEAHNSAFSNAQNIQYSIAKEIASESQVSQAQNEYNRNIAGGVGIGGGFVCGAGLVGALCFAAGPIGWIAAGVGAIIGIGGGGFAVYYDNEAEKSKQEKNGAIDYANNSNQTADKHINNDEGYIVKDLDKSIISDKVDAFIERGDLESDNITYLAVSDSSGSGEDVIYGKYEVDIKEFDSKTKLDGNGEDFNGFEEKQIAIPKEFKPFATMLVDEDLNDEKVENIDNIMENIHSGNLSYIDVNGDGFINDYDKFALEKLLNGITEEDIVSKRQQEKLSTEEQISYDINGDGYFDDEDVKTYKDLISNQNVQADLNKDGVVNEKDLTLLSQYETSIANYYRGLAEKMINVEGQVGNGTLNGKKLDEIVSGK